MISDEYRDAGRLRIGGSSVRIAALVMVLSACSLAQPAIAAGVTRASPTAACRASPPMTRMKYAQYIRRFNARDVRYADLYAGNVVFDHGKGYGMLQGRRGIVDFYRKIWRSFDETLVPAAVIIDNDDCEMAVELSTRLVARVDGVTLPSVPGGMKAGDEFVINGVVLYRLSAGKITHIRGAIDGDELLRANDLPPSSSGSHSGAGTTSMSFMGAKEPIFPAGPMTRRKYLTYLYLFNRNDPRYADLYDSDVVFTGEPFGMLHGPRAIMERFRAIHRQVRETIVPKQIVIDNRHQLMAVELINHLVALGNGVKLPAGTLSKGDELVLRGVVIYGLAHGRIDHIRGAIDGHELIAARR